MLVLTRKEGDGIVFFVGDTVVSVDVVKLGNGEVRLGCIAPKDVVILRGEVHQRRIRAELEAGNAGAARAEEGPGGDQAGSA